MHRVAYFFDSSGECVARTTLGEQENPEYQVAASEGRYVTFVIDAEGSFVESDIRNVKFVDGALKSVKPTKSLAWQWSDVRVERERLLRESDWTQFPDSPLAAQKKQQWAQYRQALRDITTQADPFNIVWPTPPA